MIPELIDSDYNFDNSYKDYQDMIQLGKKLIYASIIPTCLHVISKEVNFSLAFVDFSVLSNDFFGLQFPLQFAIVIIFSNYAPLRTSMWLCLIATMTHQIAHG